MQIGNQRLIAEGLLVLSHLVVHDLFGLRPVLSLASLQARLTSARLTVGALGTVIIVFNEVHDASPSLIDKDGVYVPWGQLVEVSAGFLYFPKCVTTTSVTFTSTRCWSW